MTREEELKELGYREKKKVVRVADRGGNYIWTSCECPTCREEQDDITYNAYCPHCGQKLDWSVTEKDLQEEPLDSGN